MWYAVGMDKKPTREVILHVRILPELKQRLDAQALEQEIATSTLARKILARHFLGK